MKQIRANIKAEDTNQNITLNVLKTMNQIIQIKGKCVRLIKSSLIRNV